jgi:hypothetical protein
VEERLGKDAAVRYSGQIRDIDFGIYLEELSEIHVQDLIQNNQFSGRYRNRKIMHRRELVVKMIETLFL